jgi:hypothetical protein
MEDIYKEVYFDQYCKNCIYEKTDEKDEPCYEWKEFCKWIERLPWSEIITCSVSKEES